MMSIVLWFSIWLCAAPADATRSHQVGLAPEEASESPGAFKWMQFGVSLAFNRFNQRVISTEKTWELWNEVLDLEGEPTGIILGQLPAASWKTPDDVNRAWFWGRTWHSISWEAFLDEENIRGDLAIVEDFEMWWTGLKDDMQKRSGSQSVEVMELPQEDMGGMDPDKIKLGVDFIHKVLSEHPGSKVYVHCKAGRGRSAAVVMAYLATHHDMDLSLAHLAVRASRTHINVDAHKIPDLHAYMLKHKMRQMAEPVFLPLSDGKTVVDVHIRARECLWKTVTDRSEQHKFCLGVLQLYDAELRKAVEAKELCSSHHARLEKKISSNSYYNGNRKLDYVCRCKDATTCKAGEDANEPCPGSRTGMNATSLSKDAWTASAFRLLKCESCKCL
eukprot:TRINITY_DN111669_c0_g1_i1.p1 TRINITY_DN111669_c0_g1~~TRINITY_DN111669_c0_g1_i1.p1  ORF type:complete len:389 (-),score=45.88 TRINITY_DN111669_c0_g1_i1:20-1186(-)